MDPITKDQVLYGTDPDAEALDGPAPVPEDAERASWHVRKANVYQAQADELAALFDAEIEALKARKAERVEVLERARDWHKDAVAEWHRRLVAAGQAAKTLHLPGGVSALTRAQPALEVEDEDLLLVWAEEHGVDHEFWPPKQIAKRAVKKRIKPETQNDEKAPEPGSRVRGVDSETGEIVPGVLFKFGDDYHNIRGEG